MNTQSPDDRDAAAQDQRPAGEAEPFDGAGMVGRRILHLTLLLILVVPLVVWLTRSASSEDPRVGGREVDEPAPDFTLQLFDDSTFDLSDHLQRDGRPVVMNFWASWCMPCREEMPALDAVARRHPEVYLLGVAVQDTETNARTFAEEVAVSYPLGLDADGTVAGLYPILGLPTTWFITSDGMIASSWAGILDQTKLEFLIEEHLTG
ncbi:MAG: TlpA family protein disulfide reductase [Acidimicrobiia bacterium]